MQSFFGGPPAAVILRLALISLLVGFILSVLGLSPFDLIDSIIRLFERIYNMGFEAIEWIIGYFLLGAVIVFPIWFVSRLWKSVSKNGTR